MDQPIPCQGQGVRAAIARRGFSQPPRGITYQAGFIANLDFLRFWIVNIRLRR